MILLDENPHPFIFFSKFWAFTNCYSKNYESEMEIGLVDKQTEVMVMNGN